MRFLTDISAVFDCNILLQATASGTSPAAACFRLVEQKIIKLFVSEETLTELEEVLNRNFIKNRFNLSDEAITEFLNNLCILAEVFVDVPKVFTLPRDIDDEIYINLAIKSEADYNCYPRQRFVGFDDRLRFAKQRISSQIQTAESC